MIIPLLFLSTPSARRATRSCPIHPADVGYFYPRPPRGGRLSSGLEMLGSWKFLSTPSARRATRSDQRPHRHPDYFYPRPPRGGRRVPLGVRVEVLDFYPRPPRGGRPVCLGLDFGDCAFLSTPSARRATIGVDRKPHIGIFLSTPSARRATRCSLPTSLPSGNFYPRPPRGGRPELLPGVRPPVEISIHALREEGDPESGEPQQ